MAYDQGLSVRGGIEEPVYRPMQRAVLHAEVVLDDGFHVYTEPVPEGFVALSFELANADGLQGWPPRVPTGSAFAIKGLDAPTVGRDPRPSTTTW